MKTFEINPRHEHIREWCINIHHNFSTHGKIIQEGRNELRIFNVEDCEELINVKRFKVPHILNKIIYSFIRKPKCVRAFEYANRLNNMGINTPKSIAYKIEKKGMMINESYLFTHHEQDMDNFFCFKSRDTNGKEHIVKQFAHFVAHMHKNGVLHKDLSPGNILFKEENGVVKFSIVDINRMKFTTVNMNTGCANFERLYGDEAFFTILSEEYALAMGYEQAECYKLITLYKSKCTKPRG